MSMAKSFYNSEEKLGCFFAQEGSGGEWKGQTKTCK